MSEQITTPEALDVDVRVYPFHGAQPRMADLFHVACARHPDFGFCGNHIEANAARVEHLGKYHRPDRPSDLAAEVERLRAGIEATVDALTRMRVTSRAIGHGSCGEAQQEAIERLRAILRADTPVPATEVAVRERVAAALYDGNEAFHAALAHERGQEYQRISRPPWVDTHEYYRALYLARADAALAVLAAAGLLADPDALARAKAEALREAADALDESYGSAGTPRESRTQWEHMAEDMLAMLRDRADRIDPTEGTRG